MKKIILFFFLILTVLCSHGRAYANDCALPAPAILKSTSQNATSVTLLWSAVPNAVLYRVSVYEAATGNPVATLYTDQTTIVVTGLLPGTTYRFGVSATACLDAPEFGEEKIIFVTTSIIIGDIIIQYDCPPPGNRETWVNGQVQFHLPIDGSQSVRIKVRDTQFNQPGYYDLYLLADGVDLSLAPIDSSNWHGENRQGDFLVSNVNNVPKFRVLILSATAVELIATVEALQSRIDIYSSRCGRSRGREEDPLGGIDENRIPPSPNPFTDELFIRHGFQPEQTADITVFDALGKVMFRREKADPETRVTSTGWPQGAYYVRVQHRGETQVFNVFKTEN